MPEPLIIHSDEVKNLEHILRDHPPIERILDRDERLKQNGDFLSLKDHLGSLFKQISVHERRFPADFDSFYGIELTLKKIPIGKIHVSQPGVEEWKYDVVNSLLKGAPVGVESIDKRASKSTYYLKIGNARVLHAYEEARSRKQDCAYISALVMRPLFSDVRDEHSYKKILDSQVDTFANNPNNRRLHMTQSRTIAGQWIEPGTKEMPAHLKPALHPMIEPYFDFGRAVLGMMSAYANSLGQNQRT